MMHDRFDSLVDLLLAGGLDAAERREAEGHAASCGPCGALLLEARSFHAWAAGAVRPDAPPADLEDRLIARFRASTAAKPRRSWPRLGRALKTVGGIAATFLLIVLGAAFSGARGLESEQLIGQLAQSAKSLELDNAVSPRGEIYDKVPANGRFGRGRALTRSGPAGLAGKERLGVNEGLERSSSLSFGMEVGVDTLSRANLHSELRAMNKDLGGNQSKLAESESLDDSGKVFVPAPTVPEPAPPAKPVAPDEPEVATLAVAKNLAHLETAMKEGKEQAVEPTRPQADRKLIRRGVISLEIETYDAASTRINAIAAEEKGYVADADTDRLANGKIHAVVVVRVPPDRFEAALAKFRALGTVRNQSVSSEDVTKAYLDFEARLGAKTVLMERLKKVLSEAKGTVKELMEVEVQMGKTQEEIESIKGELQYLAGQVSMTTIKLDLSEKDLGQPFEVVQTLQAAIGITSPETEAVYVRAQKVVTDAGGQVVDSNLVRSKDGSAKGTIKAKVDAEKFPALREELRKLGHVDVDTVVDRKTARGGTEGSAKPDAPVRKEQAVITLSIATPPIHVSRSAQLSVEAVDVDGAYLAARKAVEAAGGKVLGGSVTGRTDGMSATLTVHVETGKFVALLDGFRGLGKVLHTTSSQAVPPAEGALVTERGEITLSLSSPPVLIGEEHGIVRTIRETFAGSWAGLLWSIEKLFVGVSLAGPWLVLGLGGWLVWRRIRRKKSAQPAA
jgi:hypothetical protein